MHVSVKGAAPQRFLRTNEEDDEKSVSMYEDGDSMILPRKVEVPKPIARSMSPAQ